MGLTAVEFGEFLECESAVFVVSAQHRQRHEHFVGMEARVAAAQIVCFSVLDWLDHVLRYQFDRVIDTRQMLQGVEDQGGARAEEVACFSGYDCAVGEFDRRAMALAFFCPLFCGSCSASVRCVDLCLLHEQCDLVDFAVVAVAVCEAVEGCVVSADDFVFGSFAADLVVVDAEAYHVDTHVSRRFIRVVAVDAFEEGVEHWKYLDVAVIVDSRFSICLEVEGVDHVYIVEVGRRCFVGNVDGVFQRKAPHGECFELGISGFDAAFVFVVELAEAHSHFAASRARGCDDDQRPGCLYIVVAAEAFVRVDEVNVGGIAVDDVVEVGGDADVFETFAECVGAALSVVVGDYYRADEEAAVLKFGA